MNLIENIKKVLIVEDQDAIATGLEKVLADLNAELVHTRYCDDAWLKLKRAQLDENPYDLIITDLSFRQDHREVELKGGEDLIKTINKDNIPSKILVFSIDDRPMMVKNLIENLKINGYVLKGRNDRTELLKAIKQLSIGEVYVSKEIRDKIHHQKNISEVSEVDLLIVKFLCEGKTQEEISKLLQSKNLKPSSVSSIEKRLKNMKDDFSAKTNIELAIIFKDLGLV